MRFQPASFRPAFGRVLTIVMALIALGALIGFVVAGDLVGLLRSGWWLLLLAAGNQPCFVQANEPLRLAVRDDSNPRCT